MGMPSRAIRKATSFIEFDGQKLRLTAAFKADLVLKISAAQDMATSEVVFIHSTDGPVPMTYSELIVLRDAIITQDTETAKRELGS